MVLGFQTGWPPNLADSSASASRSSVVTISPCTLPDTRTESRQRRCTSRKLVRAGTSGICASMGMPAAMNTDSSVMYPTAAVPRASGIKLYLNHPDTYQHQLSCSICGMQRLHARPTSVAHPIRRQFDNLACQHTSSRHSPGPALQSGACCPPRGQPSAPAMRRPAPAYGLPRLVCHSKCYSRPLLGAQHCDEHMRPSRFPRSKYLVKSLPAMRGNRSPDGELESIWLIHQPHQRQARPFQMLARPQ